MQIRSDRNLKPLLWRGNLMSITKDVGGTSAVEFAIVFPLFLVLVLGILGFGLYFGAAHSTQQLAADAARASVAGLDAAERLELSNSYVKNNAGRYPLLDAAKISVVADSSPDDARDFVVAVTFDASALPIWGFDKFVPLPTKLIQRTSVVRRGGFN